MRKLGSLVLLLMAALLQPLSSEACTNMIVGKKASADGSVIVSYSADSYGLFGELYHYGATHGNKKGTMIGINEWDTGKYLGQIPQAENTYNVIGNMNEYQLTIAETTFGGREELQDPNGLIDYGSLIYLTLQRARSAREAIRTMSELVQEYGYYSEGESFSIADPNEAWIMEMIGKGPDRKGAVWVAVRIPDDCVAAHANQSRIRTFDMNDKENVMYSSDVISFAREKGYFDGLNKDFSFADAYNPLDFSGLRYCEARVWSFYNMTTSNGAYYLPYIQGKSEERMPLYWKPDHAISAKEIKKAMRDHYEGTALDITQDMGAGINHSPYRLTPLSFEVDGVKYFNERPISTQQTGWVFVAQMRDNLPDAVGGLLWFGCDDANMTVFTPVYCCTTQVPECYTRVEGADYVTFSWKSAFWMMNWVANMVYPRYDVMIGDVKAKQQALESMYEDAQEQVEAMAVRLLQEDEAKGKAMLNDYANLMAQNMIENWRNLGTFLVVKYADGVVRQEKDGKFLYNEIGQPQAVTRVGYPEDFLREYVKATGERYKMPE